jgi:homoserine O-acetyltransferase
MSERMIALIGAVTFTIITQASLLHAYDGVVEKKTFILQNYVTVGGKTIKEVKIGWESYGSLNADKSNAILITHYFSGTSHAAGKYSDNSVGYWDKITGPGKPLDTDKYFILSSDTLVNLNAKDPNVITTGPATLDPSANKPYGLSFPIVTIRDFVNVQKKLVESLGISKLHAVMGASMGALQAYEWASSYPAMVGKVIPVIGAGEADGWQIAWLGMWAAPIRLDPNWSNGDYYGKAEPVAGFSTALAMVTLHAQHWAWTNSSALGFGRKWAVQDGDPASCLVECKYAIEAALDAAGKTRAAKSDANHFLYLVKANQLFVTGGSSLVEGLKKIDAPVLLITSDDDLIFPPDAVDQTAQMIKSDGTPVEHLKIKGGYGHLDGVLAIDPAGERIAKFLGSK